MQQKKLLDKLISIARVPFVTGILSGLLTGNISLGLITAAFAIIIWGQRP
ncbi:MAG: hypothetical protein ACOC5A_04045 [Halanaerobiales bacterium]